MWTFAYWVLPLILTGVLARLDVISMQGIRYEELAESTRNVYWLQHRLIYDGVYSNVGWYGTLLVCYKILGFSLFQAKFVRLAIHLAGLFAAAALLKRAMPVRTAMLPLILVGLSPSWLYFETLQTSFGLDLDYAAICLWLIVSVRPQRDWAQLAKSTACGTVAMVAAMSYPVFLLYLPSLFLVLVWRWRRALRDEAGPPWPWLWAHAAAGVTGAALPLTAALAFVRNPQVLIFDPATHAGLFRGGGQLGFDLASMWAAVLKTLGDIFVRGGSYYFDITRPDISGLVAQAAFAVVALTFLYLAATKGVDWLISASIALLAGLSLVVPSLTIDGEPGLRRSTGLLAAYFVGVSLTWSFCTTSRIGKRGLQWIGLLACVVLVIDSVVKLPSLAADLERKNAFQNYDWFAIAPSPPESLDRLRAAVNEGQPLACPVGQDGAIVPCRFQEVYAAIAGYQQWNHLGDGRVQAIDWQTGDPIVLTPELWIDGYYPTCTRMDSCRAAMEKIFERMKAKKNGSSAK
jgi:hypothetical protein